MQNFTKKKKQRKLSDLISVGPATIEDLRQLGITHVEELVGQEALELYNRLCEITSVRHCKCMIDVFDAAIAQSENPHLEKEKSQWFYYSRIRKGN